MSKHVYHHHFNSDGGGCGDLLMKLLDGLFLLMLLKSCV